MLRIAQGLLALAMAGGLLSVGQTDTSQVGRVQKLAPDVYFHQGDLTKGHCNNAWVVFEDYVLVVDANFPSGAQEIVGKIRELTPKPIRFAFDTHHHGDHAYGNQFWTTQGATPVAHTGVLDEMKRYETGFFGGRPGRWESEARQRADLRASKLKPPSVLFPDTLIFDDGTHRVELRHFGVGHTHGDAVAWLPKEKILFTGDMAVNGPHNFLGDGDTSKWIETLGRVRELQPQRVGPGHGPLGSAQLLDDQALFFKELNRLVRAGSEGKPAGAVQPSVDAIRAELRENAAIARYVGDSLPAQVAKVYSEITGQKLPDGKAEQQALRMHLAWHGSTGQP